MPDYCWKRNGDGSIDLGVQADEGIIWFRVEFWSDAERWETSATMEALTLLLNKRKMMLLGLSTYEAILKNARIFEYIKTINGEKPHD
jgi:hypothetical protein